MNDHDIDVKKAQRHHEESFADRLVSPDGREVALAYLSSRFNLVTIAHCSPVRGEPTVTIDGRPYASFWTDAAAREAAAQWCAKWGAVRGRRLAVV